jgi:hypothetical protein
MKIKGNIFPSKVNNFIVTDSNNSNGVKIPGKRDPRW